MYEDNYNYTNRNTGSSLDEADIRKRILERRRERKRIQMRKRRIIATSVALLISVLAGMGMGKLGGLAVYKIGLRTPVSVTEDIPIVNKAVSQVGNVGGQPYWSWYGFEDRVEWCACFVSWVEDKCGYLESGSAPQFSMVGDGASWFMERDQWKYGGEAPEAGDIIFFNWDQSGSQDHVGIVTAVIGDNVYTVEGNSSDLCRQKRYKVDDPVIYGYGHINP